MHLETVNMMTKYQIVFTKLETSVRNIIRTTEAKQRNRLKRAFRSFVTNMKFQRQVLEKKKVLVYLTFEQKLK